MASSTKTTNHGWRGRRRRLAVLLAVGLIGIGGVIPFALSRRLDVPDIMPQSVPAESAALPRRTINHDETPNGTLKDDEKPAARSSDAAALTRVVGRLMFADGKPVAAAVGLFAAEENRASALGDPDGTSRFGGFELRLCGSGKFLLIAATREEEMRAFVPVVRSIVAKEGITVDLGTIVVEEDRAFTGRVRVGTEPAAGALVRAERILETSTDGCGRATVGTVEFVWLNGEPVIAATTVRANDDGRFELTGPREGVHHITATPIGHEAAVDYVERIAKNVTPPADLDFVFDGCPLTLTVIDDATGEPIRGYSFAIRDEKAARVVAEAVDGEDGAAADQMLVPATTFELLLSEADHLDARTRITTSLPGAPIHETVRMKPRPKGAALKLHVGGTRERADGFVHLVVEKVEGERRTPWLPPHGLSVPAESSPFRAWVRRDGTAVFDRLGLPPGSYMITARYNGDFGDPPYSETRWLDKTFTLEMPENGEVESSVSFERGAVIEFDLISKLAYAPSREIRVTDSRGNPVTVRFNTVGAPATLPPDSQPFVVSFSSVSALVPGNYRIAVLIDGEEKAAADVEASSAKRVELDWSRVR